MSRKPSALLPRHHPHSSILTLPSSLLLAALNTGRNSIGIDIDPQYCRFALHRLDAESGPLFGHAGIEYRKAEDLMVSATVTAVAEGTRNRQRKTRKSG